MLALGVGVATGIFSVAQHMLLRPIPVPRLDRLVVAWETDPGRDGSLIEVSYPYFQEWRAQNRSFEDLAAYGSVNWSFEFKDAPRETVSAAFVSGSFFGTLRAQALHGRTFVPEDDEAAAGGVVILSYGLWQRRYGGDPNVIGRTITGGDPSFTIIGVMPRAFDFPRGADLWTPVGPALDAERRRNNWSPAEFRSLGVLYVLGRLKDGTQREAAQADLAAVSRRLSIEDEVSEVGYSARVVPIVDHYIGTSARHALEVLAVAGACVLLLACANAVALLLLEAIRRRMDLAVRRALGASAGRLIIDYLLDSALLALAGAACGILLGAGALRGLAAFGSTAVPALATVGLDSAALVFAVAVTALVAVGVGVAPAVISSGFAVASTLRSGGAAGGLDRRALHTTRLLVTAEVTLSVVLLVGCGLMVRSLRNLMDIDLGFVPERALSFSLGLPTEKYPTAAAHRAFHRALLERIGALRGVVAAGSVHNRPLEFGPIGSDNWVLPEGPALDRESVSRNSISTNWEAVTPDYFRAVGTRLLAGRMFTERDSGDAPRVVIVSRSLARRAWGDDRPLGKRLHTHPAKAEMKDGVLVSLEWMTVVGVVQDARYRGIQDPRFDVYLPYTQVEDALRHVVVRTHRDPLALAPAVRTQVRALDPEATLGALTTMEHLVGRALAPWRFASALLGAFAITALLVTASGLFAVLHLFVSGRAREIAIRMALGADKHRVRRFVLRQAFAVTALGLASGGALSLVAARTLSALLYGVGAADPWTHLAGVGLMSAVTALAAMLPANRAIRIDPAAALRSE